MYGIGGKNICKFSDGETPISSFIYNFYDLWWILQCHIIIVIQHFNATAMVINHQPAAGDMNTRLIIASILYITLGESSTQWIMQLHFFITECKVTLLAIPRHAAGLLHWITYIHSFFFVTLIYSNAWMSLLILAGLAMVFKLCRYNIIYRGMIAAITRGL